MNYNVMKIIANPEKVYSIDDENSFSRVFKLSFGCGLLAIFIWQVAVAAAFRQGLGFFLANILLCGGVFLFFDIFYLSAVHLLAANRKNVPADDARRLIACVNFSAAILFFTLPLYFILRFLAPPLETAAIFFLISGLSVFYILLAIVKVLVYEYKKNKFQAIFLAALPCAMIGLFLFPLVVFAHIFYKYALAAFVG